MKKNSFVRAVSPRAGWSESGSFLLALSALLAALSVGTAFADQSASPQPDWTSTPSAEDEAGEAYFSGPSTDSQAAEELPHEDLDRGEALELMHAVFPPAFEGPAGIFNDLDVVAFRSNHVAVVASEDQAGQSDGGVDRALVQSTLPLRTEDETGKVAVVDLGLESAQGELQPANPLVEVDIPTKLGQGISFPESEVAVSLAGAPAERSPSTIGDSTAFYPNIATDTDFAVAPTHTGVETFAHLRSPEADHSQTYELSLPAGAVLEKTDEGGARIVRDSEILLTVLPPSAVDAEGNPVSVALAVKNHSIVLETSPTLTSAYPILVDPVFAGYYWKLNNHIDGIGDWDPISNDSRFVTKAFGAYGEPGLNVYSLDGPTIVGAQGNWGYHVPRYHSDYQSLGIRPTSFIKKMTLSWVYFWFESGSAPYPDSPYVMMGIWDENLGKWSEVGYRMGWEGGLSDPYRPYEFRNRDEVTDVKSGYAGLAAGYDTQSRARHLWVGQATLEISDKDHPGMGSLKNPQRWVNDQVTEAIDFSVADNGLGISSMRATAPKLGGGTSQWEQATGCTGSVSVPCPRSWTGGFWNYDPNALPQGEVFVEMTGRDPIGHSSDQVGTQGWARVKVDHTKPSLALSGTLTEQAKVGTTAAQYGLKYHAVDGDSSAPVAQAPFGSGGLSVGQLQRPTDIAVDAAGNSFVVDPECKCVQKYDANGNFLLQFGTPGTGSGQFTDPRGVAIGSEGVWIADFANKRVQLFSLNGNFIRQLAYQFVAPYDVAVGPENALWVSDFGGHTVYKFINGTGAPSTVRGTKSQPNKASDLYSPLGLAVDQAGTVWVTDNYLNRVTAYNANRQWVAQFGSQGVGSGQLSNPVGIAVAPATGNVLVVNNGNHRVQEFGPEGRYLRQFGAVGAGSNQFSEPLGIALRSDGTAYIADAGNKRIASWTHASYDPQSGVASTEVKVDGALVEPRYAPGCPTKDCSVSREWMLNADSFSVGQHMLEVTTTDAVGLSTTKTMTIETHGDHTPPAIALSGSMINQGELGPTRPAYTLKVNATDLGSAEERKSGVASTTIKVDGKVVDSAAPGCPAGGCSLIREWTLNSDSYSVGPHSVEVTATDGAGRSSVKALAINIARDTTAPEFNPLNAFYTAPKGWLEQKTYGYNAFANDNNGYGVVSMTLKIDGNVIKSVSGTCPAGGCSRFLGIAAMIDMATYDGGAHPAELIATDGAGNTRKRTWTIKVSPDGVIPPNEAEATVDALEETSSVNLLDPTKEEPNLEGTAPDLGIDAAAEGLVTTGGANIAELATSAGAGMVVKVASPEALEGFCVPDGDLEPANELTGVEEEELAEDPPANCTPNPAAPDGADPMLTPVEVAPTAVSPDASQTVLTEGETSTVATNVSPNVDLITRPLFDGAMTFAAIRDPAAADSFSWRVNLDVDQELKSIDNRHAAVYYKDGPAAFTITAVPAHDAIGTSVPTTLSTSGEDVITLAVSHRGMGPDGKPFVYPVVAGAGWEGGFQTYAIAMPPPEGQEEESEEGVYSQGGRAVLLFAQGPPIHNSNDPATAHLSAGSASKKKRFKFVYCMPHEFPGGQGVAHEFGETIPWTDKKNLPMIVSECSNPVLEGIFWKTSVHGWFHYIRGEWVWIKPNEFKCERGGEEQNNFAEMNCRAFFAGETRQAGSGVASKAPIKMMGNWRFRAGTGQWGVEGRATCFTMGGLLDKTPNNVAGQPVQRPMIWERGSAHWTQNCDWPGY